MKIPEGVPPFRSKLTYNCDYWSEEVVFAHHYCKAYGILEGGTKQDIIAYIAYIKTQYPKNCLEYNKECENEISLLEAKLKGLEGWYEWKSWAFKKL